MTENEGFQVAQFTFTLNSSVQPGDTWAFEFDEDTVEITVENVDSTDEIAITPILQNVNVLSTVNVTWNAGKGNFGTDTQGQVVNSKVNTITYGESAANLAPDPNKEEDPDTYPVYTGYKLKGWYLNGTDAATTLNQFEALKANTQYDALWEANTYNITYVVGDGVTMPANYPTTYTIEGVTLPQPTKAGYTFQGWTAAATANGRTGNWETTKTYNETTEITSLYGDVTLTAVWKINADSTLYKTALDADYDGAPTGYSLLIVSANTGDANHTVYYSDANNAETKMYHIAAADATTYIGMYTGDSNEKAVVDGANGVYVALIKTGTNVTDYTAGIVIKDGTDDTLNYHGDINGNGKVNFADAVAVYQVAMRGGDAYSTTGLKLRARMLADMNQDGKIDSRDVDAIVELFGTTVSE
jgi:uncharacterized repeat protein (TIGR02543 family)